MCLKGGLPKLSLCRNTHLNSRGVRELIRSVLLLTDSEALRASVIKSLLNTSDYSASPKVIFCLLAPPALEAEYALHLSA